MTGLQHWHRQAGPRLRQPARNMLNCGPSRALPGHDVFTRQRAQFAAVAGIYAAAAEFSRSTSIFVPIIIGRIPDPARYAAGTS